MFRDLLLNVVKLLQVVHFSTVLPRFGVSVLLAVAAGAGSFLTALCFGDTVPDSASVSPLDDITLPGHGLSGHHSPATLKLASYVDSQNSGILGKDRYVA